MITTYVDQIDGV